MEWRKLVHGAARPAPATFRSGDEVRVWYKILEQGKERLGQFEGIVIRCRGSGASQTFTVRRVTYGEGVERVFPMDARMIARIEVLRRGNVKRSRLYFLRDAIGKTRIAAAETQASGARPEPAVPIVDTTADVQPAGEKPEAVVAGEKSPAGNKPQA